MGYIENPDVPRNNSGLCEYIALANLLLYNELFVSPTIFTEATFKKYLSYDDFDQTLEHSSPVNKFYLNHDQDCSFPYLLWALADYQINLHTANYLTYAAKRFIARPNDWVYLQKYGGYWRAWNSVVNEDRPCLLGNCPLNGSWGFGDHVYCVYGYNDPNDSFLVSLNFGHRYSSSVLMSYYLSCWGLYYFSIAPKNQDCIQPLKKEFLYDSQYYTGREIDAMIQNGGGRDFIN